MKKRIASALLALCMIFSIVMPVGAANAGQLETTQIIVHYQRPGNDYNDWNLWVWEEGVASWSIDFTEDDSFGKVAIVQLYGEIPQVGFIVRRGDWWEKDPDMDRFITTDSSGITEIWLNQGQANVEYTAPSGAPLYDRSKLPNMIPKLTAAYMVDETTVFITSAVKFDPAEVGIHSSFIITDEDGNIIATTAIEGVEPDINSGLVSSAKLTLVSPVDIAKTYKISKQGYQEANINMASLYTQDSFNDKFYYDGDDLGAVYTKTKTNFRLWSPTATKVELKLYDSGFGGSLIKTVPMTKDVKGTWIAEEAGDLNGTYYTYEVSVAGAVNELIDPYAKAAGANGDRGMVVDLEATNPSGWHATKNPSFTNPTDAVLYEAHIRDFSIDNSSGMTNKGKYLAFTETGTKNAAGLSTGIDHIKELGVTHVHLLPSFDYKSIDETNLGDNKFNWGYDPKNYNLPEGSYSIKPEDGAVRITEYKQMVQAMHQNDIKVVMDVVYNHTGDTENSNLNLAVPDYYYRQTKSGDFSNGSGCGNETASERLMVRKFIVDSVVYWATEYKIDGFRFDLMALHDIETMNAVRAALDKIDPSIIIYGEGWDAGGSALDSSKAALKVNTAQLNNIAAFSDDIRDGVKGSVFDSDGTGFVNGSTTSIDKVKFGLAGSTKSGLAPNYYDSGWAGSPAQTINYVEAHDNLTLWDKLALSAPTASRDERVKMDKLAATMVFTAQGIPFIQLGQDFLRSKPNPALAEGFDHNSYQSSDAVNSVKWDEKTDNKDVFEYYKGLIEFRKANPALRLMTTAEVKSRVSFIDIDNQALGYRISAVTDSVDSKGDTLIYYNANTTPITVTLPNGDWTVYGNADSVGTKELDTVSGTVQVDAISALILYGGKLEVVDKSQLEKLYDDNKNKTNNDYTDETWTNFTKALGDAKTVIDDVNASKSDIDSAITALNTAIAGLTKKPTVTPNPSVSPSPSTSPNPSVSPSPSTSPNPSVSPSPSTSPNPSTSPSPSTSPNPSVSPNPSIAPTSKPNTDSQKKPANTADTFAIIPILFICIASISAISVMLYMKKGKKE